MATDKREQSLLASFGLTFLIWAVATTFRISPMNPPEWALGILYLVWWVMVFWVLVAVSFIPITFVLYLSYKIFNLPGALFCTFCFIWTLDYWMTENYPAISIIPGVALSALYAFVVFKMKGDIKT